MKSCVTISLVPEARGGPFIFWDDLQAAAATAAQVGFDAIEIFPPGPEVLRSETILPLLAAHRLKVAAIGSGAGWIKHRFSLTSPDPVVRKKAVVFIKSLIEQAAPLAAPVIVGSMQGRFEGDLSRTEALNLLAEALQELGAFAQTMNTFILYEFLNRYETNLLNRLEDTAAFLGQHNLNNVKILADLFHMNIEESSIPDAIRNGAGQIGHVHFADSNRRPVGFGHTPIGPVISALQDIGYEGYLSAEALPYPASVPAAEQTLKAFRQYIK